MTKKKATGVSRSKKESVPIATLTRSNQLAVAIMETLGTSQEVVDCYKKGTILKSQFAGIVCPIDPEHEARIKEFEEKYEVLVYHVIHSYYRMGFSTEQEKEIVEMISYLYVPKDIFYDTGLTDLDVMGAEEPEAIIIASINHTLDFARRGYVYALVVNKTWNVIEPGDIIIKAMNYGLERLY